MAPPTSATTSSVSTPPYPYTVNSWNPDVNGRVDSIALNSSCTHAYIGGRFTSVGGNTANRIAYLRTYNSNALVSDWPHSANGEVNTLLLTGTHLLAGGFFTSVNGSKRPYYVSLNSSTGKDDSYVAFSISGHYSYAGVSPNPTMVYNQQLSPLGGHVLVEGTFTTVESNPRQQIFMLNLGGSHANVSDWYSTAFNQHCATTHPFYVQAAAWSPDATTVYVADTGLRPVWLEGHLPAHRAVRRGRGVPRHPDRRAQSAVDQLHRLRLAVLGRLGRQRRLRGGPSPVVGERQRLQRGRAERDTRSGPAGPDARQRERRW